MSDWQAGFRAGYAAAREDARVHPMQGSLTHGTPLTYGACICSYSSEEDAYWHMGNCPADPNSRIPRRVSR